MNLPQLRQSLRTLSRDLAQHLEALFNIVPVLPHIVPVLPLPREPTVDETEREAIAGVGLLAIDALLVVGH